MRHLLRAAPAAFALHRHIPESAQRVGGSGSFDTETKRQVTDQGEKFALQRSGYRSYDQPGGAR